MPDSHAVDVLIRDHLPLVPHVVAELHNRIPSRVPREDLASWALLGLAAAAQAFERGRGGAFYHLAVRRIRAAVLDGLTDHGPRPRGARDITRQVGITLAEYDRVVADVQRATVVNDDVVLDVGPAGGQPGSDPVERRDRAAAMAAAIAALPEQLRRVVVGSFFENSSPADLAAELSVAQPRVAQLRAEAVAQLRARLGSQAVPAAVVQARPQHFLTAAFQA